ncbi:4-(cytidine 5'-diphospho)-2-C-methyl-D-erythritol kinase [Helicobacter monodelphidis]|uniref:4-(cytidine 5'-diphospho)-2-C-methyl-D-erythritol kinase n=1 Tax=Helicobacter sp. 15-1451 TaxID=2004995 RepID=UPI000DCE5191|nr:4-(cytidine 5'-diphospho)-2-C-methyl-D-erythritol kinase [Helicobacter sp. 15-1451]RAX58121.1 4-(cytidine 5'-diphospho)-2-C-methyl-D-erythritol kinase [Helicobacter sp. 15-1451]
MEWDSFAKVNIFLKITGKNQEGYHLLFSRFLRVDSLFDTLSLREGAKEFCVSFEGSGDFVQLSKKNTIQTAKEALEPFLSVAQKEALNHLHIHIFKRIPMGSGLAGGSSNGATFMRMVQEYLNIQLEESVWIQIAKKVGADVPFFWSRLESANVQGIGEILEPFTEEVPELEIYTPPVFCNTANVYRHYSEYFLPKQVFDTHLLQTWGNKKSEEILNGFSDLFELNDLARSAFSLYEELEDYREDGYFFSGSGSSFFRLKA